MNLWTLLLLFLLQSGSTTFSPSYTDFDIYGLKIAANDVLFAQVFNIYPFFVVRFAPYDYQSNALQCSVYYYDYTHYFYSVGVGLRQNATLNSFFYVAGEVVPDSWMKTDFSGRNGTFIGILINDDPNDVLYYLMNHQPLSCDYFYPDHYEYVSTYDHQEYFVMGVEPYGHYALGLAEDFVVRYEPFATPAMRSKPASDIWPKDITFYPAAIDLSETFTVVAGFADNATQSRSRVTPTVYLMSNDNFTIRSAWSYTPTNNSWQSRLTYSNIALWNKRYTMSVKINPFDARRVLVGMPFLNTVFMFVVENNGTRLRLTSSDDRGASTGYGKSVSWLGENQAGILDWSYTLDGRTFRSSTVKILLSLDTDKIDSSSSALIPNLHQPMPSNMINEWIRVISTPSALVIMDVNGGTMMILSEEPGVYPSTDTTGALHIASIPSISHPTPCPSGTYKTDRGVHSCGLCPSGTHSPAGLGTSQCINCSSQNYCPLGAAYEVSSTWLTDLSQAYAYPQSPEMDVFEDVLLYNLFLFSPNTHCLLVSPIFWTLVLLAMVTVFLIGIASMNLCVKPEKREKLRARIKYIFQRTDLVGEGELWLGGLASLAVVLITVMAYYFAISFMHQYPAEDVGPSRFACDSTLRNAKYSSTLQSLAVPISDSEKPLHDMLAGQHFTLKLDLLNTNASCFSISVSEMIESSSTIISSLNCSNSNGIVSVTAPLSQHDISVKIVLHTIELVGGFRLGIVGPRLERDSYTVQEVNFRKTFANVTRTLAPAAKVQLVMTKVINETEPFSGDNSIYSGIWYPVFDYSVDEILMTAEKYAMISGSGSTILTVTISETTYYIKNVQSPIAKRPEVIFRTLLFSLLCLELCAISFLLCKLLLIPIAMKVYQCCLRRSNVVKPFE